MTVYGHDHRNPRSATARIENIQDKKGEGGGKGDQAGFYQIRVHGTQDGIEKDKLIFVPQLRTGTASQKMGQFIPQQLGDDVQVQFDDMHQMSGHIIGSYSTAGKGTGGSTVDGATGVDNKTNSLPQYARGDVRQPVNIGWAKSEHEQFRSDDSSYYKDIDEFRSKTVKNGKRMTAAYGDKTLGADQSYG